jgi:hypothetical protein
MRQKSFLVAGFALLVLFACFVWPTPYRYFVLPPVPPNAADPSDGGIPPQLVRMNRFTERTWVLHGGVTWYSPEERTEIAQRESQEIRKRCGNAEATGAFSGPRDRRVVELKGYAFPCQ